MAEIVACASCGKKNRVPPTAAGLPRCASCHADLPWLINAGESDFVAAARSSVLVLVDLWAPWCGPCRMVAPGVERAASEFAGKLKVVKVNVDENPRIASLHGIRSIPALKLFRGPLEVDQQVGALPKDAIDMWLDRFI